MVKKYKKIKLQKKKKIKLEKKKKRMSKNRQEKLYLPENPLMHSELAKSGKIKFFSSITDKKFGQLLTNPCLIFVGHPSLRFGDIVHLIKIMGNNPRNSLIMIENEYNFQDCISAYESLEMRFFFIFISNNY